MAQKNFKGAADMFFSSVKMQQEAPQGQNNFTVPKGYKLTKESKSVRMTILIRPTTKEALQRVTDSQGISMNELINQLIENYLEGQGKE